MNKYKVKILLANGESINIDNVEASSESDAINKVSDEGNIFNTFNDEKSQYRIYKEHIVGFKVTDKENLKAKTQRINY